MRCLDTKYVYNSILDDQTILVEAKDGVEIDDEISKYNSHLIESAMPGNYGMIIDRKSDYSIVPIAVYNNLNKLEKLKAIAIVVHNKPNFLPVEAERSLFKGELEVFEYIREAHQWITKVI